MSLSIPAIVGVFEARGHALQSAQLAEQAGAGSALISASLLHDVGGTPTQQGLDDLRRYRCLPFLRAGFGLATLEPIRLHVEAKRFQCKREAGCLEALSADSKRSVRLQGSVFDDAQARALEAQPHAMDAVRLRRWDDMAKRADANVPDLAHFVRRLEIGAAERRSVVLA